MSNKFATGYFADGSGTAIEQYRAVVPDGTNGVGWAKAPAAANDVPIGIGQEKITKARETLSVVTAGESFAVAAAAISIGDRLCVADTVGKVKAAAAKLTTALAGDDNDLVYTAKAPYQGAIGETISVSYVDPAGNNQPLAVTVLGNHIKVSLATGSAGAITSTADDIKTAIAANSRANALVSVADSGADDGSGVVTAMAESGLTGGAGDFATALEAASADGDVIKVLVD